MRHCLTHYRDPIIFIINQRVKFFGGQQKHVTHPTWINWGRQQKHVTHPTFDWGRQQKHVTHPTFDWGRQQKHVTHHFTQKPCQQNINLIHHTNGNMKFAI